MSAPMQLFMSMSMCVSMSMSVSTWSSLILVEKQAKKEKRVKKGMIHKGENRGNFSEFRNKNLRVEKKVLVYVRVCMCVCLYVCVDEMVSATVLSKPTSIQQVLMVRD